MLYCFKVSITLIMYNFYNFDNKQTLLNKKIYKSYWKIVNKY